MVLLKITKAGKELFCVVNQTRPIEKLTLMNGNSRHVHVDQHIVQCIALNKLLYTSCMNYYRDKITETGRNTKTLFKIAKELTGHNENPILPSDNDPNILDN